MICLFVDHQTLGIMLFELLYFCLEQKSPSTMGREFSPAHAKGATLEKAFLELEKRVAECEEIQIF